MTFRRPEATKLHEGNDGNLFFTDVLNIFFSRRTIIINLIVIYFPRLKVRRSPGTSNQKNYILRLENGQLSNRNFFPTLFFCWGSSILFALTYCLLICCNISLTEKLQCFRFPVESSTCDENFTESIQRVGETFDLCIFKTFSFSFLILLLFWSSTNFR